MLYIRFPGYCMVGYSKRVCSCDTCTRYVLCTSMGSWVIKMTAITSTFRKHLLDSVGYGNPYQLVVVSGHEKTRSELLSMPPGIESSFSRTRICALERAVTNASSGTCGDTIPTQTKLLPQCTCFWGKSLKMATYDPEWPTFKARKGFPVGLKCRPPCSRANT